MPFWRRESGSIESVSAGDFLSEYHQGTKSRIVDVREPDEWRQGHIRGATLMPLGSLSSRMKELDKDAAIVVVCRSGSRSSMAARLLSGHGYRVRNLAGGMMAWRGPLEG